MLLAAGGTGIRQNGLKYFKESISRRFVGVMVAVNAAVLACVLLFFTFSQQRTLHSHFDDRINTQLTVLSSTLAPSIFFHDKRQALAILETLQTDRAVLRADVFNSAGDLFASYASTQASSRDSTDLEINRLLSYEGEALGRIEIHVSRGELKQLLSRMVGYSVLIYVFSVGISFVLIQWMNSIISAPFRELLTTVRAVAHTKDYSLRINVAGRDELSHLGSQFNIMLNRIEEREKALEKKISQRTEELQSLAEQFRHRALHDSLTGLRNRAYLLDYFDHAVAHAQRYDLKFALILLDLDNFKTINDTLGHDAGDELLRVVANRLVNHLRREDTVVRLGGDEFVILIENVKHPHNFSAVSDLILNTIKQEVTLGKQKVKVTASLGASVYPDHGTDLNLLKRNADIAMYQSKDQGRNQFQLFESSMEDQPAFRFLVQSDLPAALENRELQLYFQPKVDGRNGKIIGCEALIRWNHPRHGFLSPDSFISMAEQTGFVRDIDYYVINEACRQLAVWRNAADIEAIPIAVNISATQFADNQFTRKLSSILQNTETPPHLLQLEITEASFIHKPQDTINILNRIRSLGIKLSLDDFGTGYSSLSYLRQLPLDEVKLDRSFITDLVGNRRDAELIRGIVSLVQKLGFSVIAEGIESEQQMGQLLELGCYMMQGYYFMPPVTAAALESYITVNTEQRKQLKASESKTGMAS